MESQSTPVAKQKGIKKLWFRIKASMKTEQSTKPKGTTTTMPSRPANSTTAATSSPPAATQSTSEPVVVKVADPTEPELNEPEIAKAAEEARPTSQPSFTAAAIIVVDDEEEDPNEKFQVSHTRTTSYDKEATAIRYLRAQDMYKKYNLELAPADWQQTDKSSIPRIEKKPRMRVRYTCHECSQGFGRDKTCIGCSHARCDTCVRYPAKKIGVKGKQAKLVEVDPLTLSTPTTGECHECKTTFNIGASKCENCQHQICSRCLKETIMTSPATAPPPAQSVTVAAAS